MDSSYTEAFYLLAQVYERMGRTELAEQALARVSGPSDLSIISPARTRKSVQLFRGTKSGPPRLMAGIDKRIADALREDALQAFKIGNQQSH